MQKINSHDRTMLVAIHLCTLDQDAREAPPFGGSKVVRTERAFGVFRRIYTAGSARTAVSRLVDAELVDYCDEPDFSQDVPSPEIYLLPAGVDAVEAIVGAK